MAGTRAGGLKTEKINKQRYGEDYYVRIGAMGGRTSKGGGFAKNPELASRAGRIGGKIGKRGKSGAKKGSSPKEEIRRKLFRWPWQKRRAER